MSVSVYIVSDVLHKGQTFPSTFLLDHAVFSVVYGQVPYDDQIRCVPTSEMLTPSPKYNTVCCNILVTILFVTYSTFW